MSAQDKIEQILKRIHVLLAEGESVSGDRDKIAVDKKEVLATLEQLNLAVYEIMDQYEVTSQARELAERRTEKKGEEMIARISAQAEDVYAASLMYTDEALRKLQRLMTETMASNQEIWNKFNMELEQEKRRMKDDQKELREQLQDFKDSNKYLVMIEECNREREKQEKEKDGKASEKKIQNEAKHYGMNGKPEIKVNPAYFERRGIEMPSETPDVSPEPETSFAAPEIKVDLDAEYFKWQAEEAAEDKGTMKGKQAAGDKGTMKNKQAAGDKGTMKGKQAAEGSETDGKASIRKEWKSLFGKKN